MDLMIAELLGEISFELPPPNINGVGAFRRWFNGCDMHVYIRVGQRIIGGRFVRTLELSNVTVDEGSRGQGRFSYLLDGLTALARMRGETLFVESVLNEIVRGALVRRGFVDYRGDGMNYVKLQPQTKGNQ
jgi:GNAT superfamily N-acetyltransferase